MKDADWQLRAEGYDPAAVTETGNRFLLGNGAMGYRGTLEEYTRSEQVALNLGGVYDQHGDQWREPVNAPNPLFTQLTVAGQPVSALTQTPAAHTLTLAMHQATLTRRSEFVVDGVRVVIRSERFLSAADQAVGAMQYSVEADAAVAATLTCGIDQAVWDINGPHLTGMQLTPTAHGFTLAATTGELHRHVTVWQKQFLSVAGTPTLVDTPQGPQARYALQLAPNVPVTLTVLFGVGVDAQIPAVAATMQTATAATYAQWRQAHVATWADHWRHSDIEIAGAPADQLHLRYSIYQLLAIAPHGAAAQSIPARGLSGQTYKGAIFWDTEMFMLPFFLATDAQTARSLVNYRIQGLQGARAKAQAYGFRGAFYAWESQENGFDACSDYNVTDVFTKRPMRTYFRDKQVHISAAIALALWQTYDWLDDLTVLTDGGAEVILECARFYLDYARRGLLSGVVEVADVIGPDEYHERVTNNAYTNKMVATTWQLALATIKTLQAQAPQVATALIDQLDAQTMLDALPGALAALRGPRTNADGVIEQFDGYFALEDCSVATVRSRLLDPHEYWGGAYGVAAQTQVLKQADVVMMQALFPADYTAGAQRAAYD